MFTRAVMSCTSSDWAQAQVHPGPRDTVLCCEKCRGRGWAHYLSAISEEPLRWGSGPITTSVSASGEKSNRCLPLCWVEKASCLEPPWNSLMKQRTGEVRKRGRWGKIRTLRTKQTNRKEGLGTGGFLFFSHKQNLNSDLDCITQSMLGHPHKQNYAHSLFQRYYYPGRHFHFKGIGPQKRAYFAFQRRAQTQNTQMWAQVQTHTDFSYREFPLSRKSKLIHGSKEPFSCLSPREQLKEHIPSTERTQIIKANKSDKWMLASLWRKLFPGENKHFYNMRTENSSLQLELDCELEFVELHNLSIC